MPEKRNDMQLKTYHKMSTGTYHLALKPLTDLDEMPQPIHQTGIPRILELTAHARVALVDLHDEHLVELLTLSWDADLRATGGVDILERPRQHIGLITPGQHVSRAASEEREMVGRDFTWSFCCKVDEVC